MTEKIPIFTPEDQIVENHLNGLAAQKIAEQALPYPELIGHLPRAIQADIVDSVENIKPYLKAGEENLNAVIQEIMKKVLLQYEKRFNLPNKEFSKQKTLDLIFKLLENDPKPEDLKKVARLSFDVNGLKKVNDWNASHEKGDQYLAVIAGVFKNEANSAFKWLKDNGLEYLVTDDGGDEFGLVIWSDSREIGDEEINRALELFNEEMDALEVDDCLDLNDDKVLMKFAGIEKDDPEKAGKLAEARRGLPEDFSFTAVVSGGGANLFKAYYEAIQSGKVDSKGDYSQQIKAMMGSLFDLSDKRMQEEKESFKAGLETSSDPMEQLLFKIYTRSEEEVKLKEEIARLMRENEELKKAKE